MPNQNNPDYVNESEQSTNAVNPRSEKSQNLIIDVYTGTAEKTFAGGSTYAKFYRRPYNPDDIIQKTGDYTIYEDMGVDEQVSVCLQLKRDLIIAAGWDVVPSDDSDLQKEIAEDVECSLRDDAQGPDDDSFDDMLEEVMSSLQYGFSLSEKIFKVRHDGSMTLKCLKTRHPSTWLLHTDDHGEITKYEQYGPQGAVDVVPESILHFVNNPGFQNPYGTSDLRRAYLPWFTKRQIVKYYAIFLEKAASPTPVARYDKNAPQAAVDRIYTAIKSLQTKTALAIPKEIEIDFMEAKSNGEAFARGMEIFNMFIGRALIIPDLMGFQGAETGGGSYSLGQEQIGVFFKHLKRKREKLERAINKHIVWPLVMSNYGIIDDYPKFKLRPIDDKYLVELSKLWLEFAKGRLYKPSDAEINHFRKIVEFPEGEVERDEQPKGQFAGFGSGGDADPSGSDHKPEMDMHEMPENKETTEEHDDAKSKEKVTKEKEVMIKNSRAVKPAETPFGLPPGNYSKKVNFAKIENQMMHYKDAIMTATAPVVTKIINDLIEQISAKKIVEGVKIEKIASIKLKYLAELHKILTGQLGEAYRDAYSIAESELNKGKFQHNVKQPLTDEKYLEVLDNENYELIGDWEYTLTKKARIEISAAVRDGKPLSEVAGILDNEGHKLSDVQIERYARTKLTEVMNRARVAYFNESGVVAAYQYSAILDDRVTEVCAGLDGKVFNEGDQPIPPLHFNCRSVLVPITKYESFTPDKTVTLNEGEQSERDVDIDDFIEENKGKGFAVQ